MSRTPNVEAALQQGLSLHQQGRIADALHHYRTGLKGAPGDPDLLHLSGLALAQSGDLATGLKQIKRALSQQPSNPAIRLNLAQLYLQADQADKAARECRAVLKGDPQSLQALVQLGQALLKSDQALDAVEPLGRAAAQAPRDADLQNLYGTALLWAGEAGAAAEIFRKALSLQPGATEALHNLATALTDLGAVEEAAVTAGKAFARNRDLKAARWQQALCLLDLEGVGAAIAALRDALPMPQAKGYLAALQLEVGEDEEAARLFAEAGQDDPKMAALEEACRYRLDAQEKSGAPIARYGVKAGQLRAALGERRVEGLNLEFGVFTGRSITILAEDTHSQFHGFDSFEGLPEAWTMGQGGRGEGAGSYSTRGKLPAAPANVTLHQGWFDQSLPDFLAAHGGPVALANIDCDIYSSTKTVLELLGDRLVPGSLLIFDEYFAYPGWREHEYKAFQDWLAGRALSYDYLALSPFTRQATIRLKDR